MYGIKVTVIGDQKVISGMMKYPAEVDTMGLNINKLCANETRKSAKLRVKRWSTELAESIKANPMKNKTDWEVIAESPYAAYQEGGFRPHWVHKSWSTKVGRTFEEWMLSKSIINPKTGMVPEWLKVGTGTKPYKPFMGPAASAVIQRMPQIITRELEKGVRKAFG